MKRNHRCSLFLAWMLILAPVSRSPAQDGAPQESAAPAESRSVDARVLSAEGDVLIFYADQASEPVPADSGTPLAAGDRIQTGSGSRAELGLDGDSVIEIGPDSELTVSSLDPGDMSFGLKIGSVLAKMRSLLSANARLSVRTPVAVASVRGTEFAVEHDAQGDSHVGVFEEGKVSLTSLSGEGAERVLEAEQEVSVRQGFDPQAVEIRKLERFQRLRARMKVVRQRAQGLRKRWRAIAAPQRLEMRRNAIERRRNLMRRIREKRRTLRRGNPEQRGRPGRR